MGELRGLISIDELEALTGSDEIDTVVTAFTDHYGTGSWKALHGPSFPGGDLRARDPRL